MVKQKRRQKNLYQSKDQKKTPGKTSETETDNLSDKWPKTLIVRMLIELGKRIDEHN